MSAAAFKVGGRATYTVKVYDRKKDEWVQRGIRTKDSVTAKRIQSMIEAIHAQGKRAWEIVDALVDQTFTVPEVYDIYLEEKRDLERVKIRLQDVDLEPYVKEWAKNPGGRVKPKSDSADRYVYYVRQLIPRKKPFPLSRFTSDGIQQHIEDIEASAATKRKAAAAISSFGRWLYRKKVIRTKPMRDVELPPAPPPRIHFIETSEAIRLAEAQPSPYREFSALLAGTAIDVSVALDLRRRDVDMKHREIRAAGTKFHTRDRIARVAEWAWPYVERMAKGLTPDAKLFAEIPDRWRAAVHHDEAIYGFAASQRRDESKGLVKEFPIYDGYTMRDARHTWAVRAARSGIPAELGARQMGHANPVLFHKVYGRFMPRQDERDKWEQIATLQDAEQKKEQAKEEEK